jgi:hypothetical protein
MTIKQNFLVTAAAIGLGLAAVSVTAVAQPGSSDYSADAVSIENFIGTVEVRTGSSSRISLSITNPGEVAEDPQVNQSGNTLLIDGGQQLRGLNCNSRNGHMRFGRNWRSGHDIEEYPTLVITAPADLALAMRNSAFSAQTGALGSLDLAVRSCGNFNSEDIAGEVNLRISGSADVTTGSVGGDANVQISGSGDVIFDGISGSTMLAISGSGDVETGDVGGSAEVDINGSGDIKFGRINDLDLHISGSGDVDVGSINGAFETRVSGSGDVQVASGRAEPFEVSINGSGDIRFGGTAVNVTVRESGSGDVHIEEIEGSVDWRRNGRTVLRVGNVN